MKTDINKEHIDYLRSKFAKQYYIFSVKEHGTDNWQKFTLDRNEFYSARREITHFAKLRKHAQDKVWSQIAVENYRLDLVELVNKNHIKFFPNTAFMEICFDNPVWIKGLEPHIDSYWEVKFEVIKPQ